MSDSTDFNSLRTAFGSFSQLSDQATDYQITHSIGYAYVGRSRSGSPTLLIPLREVSSGLSRFGGGFSLIPAQRVAYSFLERSWEQPSAALECTDSRLLETFIVLCAD